jgi:hypothetical protein
MEFLLGMCGIGSWNYLGYFYGKEIEQMKISSLFQFFDMFNVCGVVNC